MARNDRLVSREPGASGHRGTCHCDYACQGETAYSRHGLILPFTVTDTEAGTADYRSFSVDGRCTGSQVHLFTANSYWLPRLLRLQH